MRFLSPALELAVTPAPPPRVAVVGAGIAGLSCAQRLRQGGWDVRLFDKARAPGGRCATRRADAAFDHGAQFFTARDPRFGAFVAELVASGDAAVWPGPFGTLTRGARGEDPRPGAVRFVAVPGMSALPRALAAGLEIASKRLVTVLRAASDGLWWLGSCDPSSFDLGGSVPDEPEQWHGPFDRIVLALPPRQAEVLLADCAGPVAKAARRLRDALQPCLCAMVRFASPVEGGVGGMFVQDDVLSWAAHDGGKPGREASPTYVLHATADWSRQHLQGDPDQNAAELVAAFGRALATELPPVAERIGHRWAFALAGGDGLEANYVCDPEGLALVGDALAGGRVEGAFVSGLDLAEAWLAEVAV